MGITKVKKLDKAVSWGAKDKSGKIMNFYDNCTNKITPGISKVTKQLHTGLTKEQEKKFETSIGLEPGTLAKTSPYWDSFSVIIPKGGLTLNTAIAQDALIEAVLSKDPLVANSLDDAKTNPYAEYVMTSDTAEAKSKNTKRNTIASAYAKFAKMSNMDIIDALFMLGKDPSDLDSEVAQNRLGEMVEQKPAKFLEIVGDKLFKDKVFFMKLIKAGVVRKHGTGTGTNMPLYYEDIMLGSNLEEAIAFIKSKENQQIALAIKGAYKAEVSK